ncbi:MAG: NUDIX hydrolase [Lysobacteraceae bacterium]|nr:MAG: NUDIX hydrolase [Xanthomonadaceae bacterium]
MKGSTKQQAVSCGTLVVDAQRRLLLCHVTGTGKWDIPKGMQDPGESALEAAMRELREETGLVFAQERFVEIGRIAYRPDKALHLFRVDAGDALPTLDHLACHSFFPHHVTGKPTPETDGFRWATRTEAARLCWPRMAERLMAIDW